MNNPTEKILSIIKKENTKESGVVRLLTGKRARSLIGHSQYQYNLFISSLSFEEVSVILEKLDIKNEEKHAGILSSLYKRIISDYRLINLFGKEMSKWKDISIFDIPKTCTSLEIKGLLKSKKIKLGKQYSDAYIKYYASNISPIDEDIHSKTFNQVIETLVFLEGFCE